MLFLYCVQWKQALKVEVHDIKFYLAFAWSGFSFSNVERNSYPFMHIALIYSAVNDTSPCVREHIFFQTDLYKRCFWLLRDNNSNR